MGELVITVSGMVDVSAVPGINTVTFVGAGGMGTNGYDDGSNAGVGKAGNPGQVVVLNNVPLAGSLAAIIGQPVACREDVPTSPVGEVPLSQPQYGTTSLGLLGQALGGGTGTMRKVRDGLDNGSGYGAGGPGGSPDDPITDTRGQAGAIIISWED